MNSQNNRQFASAPDASRGQRVLQYDGVVKADISECPVNYHHVSVEDLSAQLQQAEHCTPVKLWKRKSTMKMWKNQVKKSHKDVQSFLTSWAQSMLVSHSD